MILNFFFIFLIYILIFIYSLTIKRTFIIERDEKKKGNCCLYQVIGA